MFSVTSLTRSLSNDYGVFGTLPSILTESQNTLRRIKLYSVLSEYGPLKCDMQIRVMSVWKNIYPELNESNFRDIIENGIEKIERINIAFNQIYVGVNSSDSFQTAKQLVKRYIEDRHYLTDSMIIHSTAGDRGTLIVTYPLSEARKNHVIKWVNDLEIDSTRVYQLFSRCIPDTFLVPDFVQIHLDRKMHISMNGKSTEIQDSLFYQLKMNYSEVLNNVPRSDQTIEHVEETLRNANLMFSEKVQGEGLFDFINSKYVEMNSTQKEELFKKMGSLVLLDLLLHHNDRVNIVKFNSDTSKYELTLKSQNLVSEGTNLNNLMIDSDKVVVYAIDNGLEGDKSFEESILYTEFLKELFSQDNWVISVSQAIAETFENTLADGVGLSDQESLFIDDLKIFGMRAIQKGIADLYDNLGRYFLHSDINELNELLIDSPVLLNAILDRKNLLLSLRTNHDS